jgi:dihydroxy-acid dehydratase
VDAMSQQTPVLTDLKPVGRHYMEDFHKAGGVPALMAELRDVLRLDALTVTGRTVGQQLDLTSHTFPQDVVRRRDDPIYPVGGLAVVRGNLAPGSAIVKRAAASPELLEHRGRAVVFENSADLAARIDSDDLDVRSDDVLVLKNIGPVGAPGMPEAGYLPIPRKLARQGIKDMVRISDGRMSGTAFGTIVLHVSPEAAVGGPLRYVQTGDMVRLSVTRKELMHEIDPDELSKRRRADPVWSSRRFDRGYLRLYTEQVTQAEEGCDFRFLQSPEAGKTVPEPS